VSQPCTVIIGSSALLAALEQRVSSLAGEVLTFSDAEVLRALEAILARRPSVVALERLFAATPRGAALIKRIKADPELGRCEIRVISHDSSYSRVSPRADAAPAPAAATVAATLIAEPLVTAPAELVEAPAPAPVPSPPLDHRGTRRAPRFRMANTDVLVDGKQAALVDLATIGAQVVSEAALKPKQRVRVSLGDEEGAVRVNAVVAWAAFEIPPGSAPRYRAGLEFIDADQAAVDAFSVRHREQA
jgi:hypothetical protein